MIDLPSPTLIGVIHLRPLPGSAAHTLSMDEIVERAQTDAETLATAGFDAAIIENFGDAPFTAGSIAPASAAAMAIIASRVRRDTRLRVGINALRNDARSALGIAAASGASFIRVNVHVGVYATDQGMIQGRADETLRERRLLGHKVAIFADVHVKHAVPISQPDIVRAARETAYRGLADGLIVTGPATGEAVNMESLRMVHEAVPDRRLFVGSGATAETASTLLTVANGIIVGSGLKPGRDPARPIDGEEARAFVRAAGRA
jgi:hypothetical protein